MHSNEIFKSIYVKLIGGCPLSQIRSFIYVDIAKEGKKNYFNFFSSQAGVCVVCLSRSFEVVVVALKSINRAMHMITI